MSIKNIQLENAPKKQTPSIPITQSGEGAFYVDDVNGIVEAFYMDDNGNEVQLTEDGKLAGSAQTISDELLNSSGTTMTVLQPVSLNSSGAAVAIDVSIEALAAKFYGIVETNAANGAQVSVIRGGRLEDVTTSAAVSDLIYVSKTGTLTNTIPDIGVGGFLAGDFVIEVGKIVKNVDDSMKKDLIITPWVVGQL